MQKCYMEKKTKTNDTNKNANKDSIMSKHKRGELQSKQEIHLLRYYYNQNTSSFLLNILLSLKISNIFVATAGKQRYRKVKCSKH